MRVPCSRGCGESSSVPPGSPRRGRLPPLARLARSRRVSWCASCTGPASSGTPVVRSCSGALARPARRSGSHPHPRPTRRSSSTGASRYWRHRGPPQENPVCTASSRNRTWWQGCEPCSRRPGRPRRTLPRTVVRRFPVSMTPSGTSCGPWRPAIRTRPRPADWECPCEPTADGSPPSWPHWARSPASRPVCGPARSSDGTRTPDGVPAAGGGHEPCHNMPAGPANSGHQRSDSAAAADPGAARPGEARTRTGLGRPGPSPVRGQPPGGPPQGPPRGLNRFHPPLGTTWSCGAGSSGLPCAGTDPDPVARPGAACRFPVRRAARRHSRGRKV